MRIPVLERHRHLVHVNTAVGQEALRHLIVRPLVSDALQDVYDAAVVHRPVNHVLDAAHEVGADQDAAVDVRRRAAHIQLAVEVERVEETSGGVAADELVHHHRDLLPVAADLDVVPLEVVQQAAALRERLADVLDSGAQVDARVDGAVAQLDGHVVVVLRALGVEEEGVALVGAEAEEQLVL